jgi:hypothetical protein
MTADDTPAGEQLAGLLDTLPGGGPPRPVPPFPVVAVDEWALLLERATIDGQPGFGKTSLPDWIEAGLAAARRRPGDVR